MGHLDGEVATSGRCPICGRVPTLVGGQLLGTRHEFPGRGCWFSTSELRPLATEGGGSSADAAVALGDRQDDYGGVVLEGLARAVGHSLRDGHSRGRRGGMVGFGEGAFEALDAEASAALNPPVGDAVGDEDETLAGVQLALHGPKARLGVDGA